MKNYHVTALGELLIDFTENGLSSQGNYLMEANPGGAPCNVLAMLTKLGKKTAFIGKVGNDFLGNHLKTVVQNVGIDTRNLLMDDQVHTTLAFVHTYPDGDRDFSFYRNPGADMNLCAEEIDEDLDYLNEYIEEIDEDLSDVEDFLDEECCCDEDEDEEDYDFDDEEYEECDGDCASCDGCDCGDEDYFEIVCPSCGETVCFVSELDPENLLCPACGEKFGCIVDEDDYKAITFDEE